MHISLQSPTQQGSLQKRLIGQSHITFTIPEDCAGTQEEPVVILLLTDVNSAFLCSVKDKVLHFVHPLASSANIMDQLWSSSFIRVGAD